jgi:hypothetical protein
MSFHANAVHGRTTCYHMRLEKVVAIGVNRLLDTLSIEFMLEFRNRLRRC